MKNKYLETNDKKYCNGCGICAKVCPVDAIKMVEDNEGFLYPNIDENRCIKCQRCKKICSNFNNKNLYTEKAFAGYTKSDKELNECSSGGIFYIMARYVIERKGVVFGVRFNKELKAEHDYAETLEECKKFRGSKYVRSDIKNSYEKVKEFLEEGRLVLFTGTPCQCSALKVYLGKKYEKLILCDIICHANPSPKVFSKYVRELEKKKNLKVVNVHFRTKENGWENQTPIIEYENNFKEEENSYFIAFVRELLGRPSCHYCPFASINRVTDFTIGDLWGREKINISIKQDKGLSLFTINSKKAEKIFGEVKSFMEYEQIENGEAYKYNHYSNVHKHKNREKFYKQIDSNNSIIELLHKYSKYSIPVRLKNKFKYIIKRRKR